MDFSKIRLVGLDLDGTVFTDAKKITPRTKKAIITAIANGVTVVPATGRPVVGIPKEFTEIPGVRYLLGSNGASVYDQETETFLVHECMDQETVLAAMRVFSKEDCSFEVYVDGVPHIKREELVRAEHFYPNPFIRSYVLKTRVPENNLEIFLMEDGRGVEKINMSFPSVHAKEKAMPLLEKLSNVNGVCGLPNNLELSRSDVDKGEGLLALARCLGLQREGTLSCGDSENDLAMIQKAGIGVAMGNAEVRVKENADFVLSYTNEQEGVAWLLEEIVKQKNCCDSIE